MSSTMIEFHFIYTAYKWLKLNYNKTTKIYLGNKFIYACNTINVVYVLCKHNYIECLCKKASNKYHRTSILVWC